MATFEQALDTLRGRFMRAKGARPLTEMALAIGVSRPTLVTFLHGKASTTGTILAVERWVEQEETRTLREAVPHD